MHTTTEYNKHASIRLLIAMHVWVATQGCMIKSHLNLVVHGGIGVSR